MKVCDYCHGNRQEVMWFTHRVCTRCFKRLKNQRERQLRLRERELSTIKQTNTDDKKVFKSRKR
jgi:hypothetical protein